MEEIYRVLGGEAVSGISDQDLRNKLWDNWFDAEATIKWALGLSFPYAGTSMLFTLALEEQIRRNRRGEISTIYFPLPPPPPLDDHDGLVGIPCYQEGAYWSPVALEILQFVCRRYSDLRYQTASLTIHPSLRMASQLLTNRRLYFFISISLEMAGDSMVVPTSHSLLLRKEKCRKNTWENQNQKKICYLISAMTPSRARKSSARFLSIPN
jgi:hypothetical protein